MPDSFIPAIRKAVMMTRRRQALFAAVTIVLVLLVFELGSFLLLRTIGSTKYQRRTVAQLFHPFRGWGNAPRTTRTIPMCGGKYQSEIDVDKHGRVVTPRFGFPDPDLRIVITGGSTVFGMGSSTSATTVPSYLEQIIYDSTGLKVEVYNLGVLSYTSFQQMLSLYEFLQGNDADLALAVGGFNDSAFGAFQPDARSASLPRKAYETAAFVRAAEREELSAIRAGLHILVGRLRAGSWTVELFYEMWLKLRQRIGAGASPSRGDDWVESYDNIGERVLATNTHYALMNTIAKEKGVRFAMFLQPTALTKRALTESEVDCMRVSKSAEKLKYLDEYQRRFYDAFRSVGKSFTFHDISHCLDDIETDAYVDSSHYTDAAAFIVAEVLFQKIDVWTEDQ
jgi:hypothetical protein